MDPWYVIFEELGLNVSSVNRSWFLWMLSFLITAIHDICIAQRDIVPQMLICFAFLLSGDSSMRSILAETKINPENLKGLKGYIRLMIVLKRLSIFQSWTAGVLSRSVY